MTVCRKTHQPQRPHFAHWREAIAQTTEGRTQRIQSKQDVKLVDLADSRRPISTTHAKGVRAKRNACEKNAEPRGCDPARGLVQQELRKKRGEVMHPQPPSLPTQQGCAESVQETASQGSRAPQARPVRLGWASGQNRSQAIHIMRTAQHVQDQTKKLIRESQGLSDRRTLGGQGARACCAEFSRTRLPNLSRAAAAGIRAPSHRIPVLHGGGRGSWQPVGIRSNYAAGSAAETPATAELGRTAESLERHDWRCRRHAWLRRRPRSLGFLRLLLPAEALLLEALRGGAVGDNDCHGAGLPPKSPQKPLGAPCLINFLGI